MLPGPCSSIVISQVRWGCGVPRTEAIPMECCVSLGLLFRNVLSAAEFTLKRAGTMQDQLSLPHKAQWQPSPVQLLPVLRGWCCEPNSLPTVLQKLHDPREEREEEARRVLLQAKVPFPYLEYAESLRKPEGKVFCQLLTDEVEGAGQQETTCGFLNLHPPVLPAALL